MIVTGKGALIYDFGQLFLRGRSRAEEAPGMGSVEKIAA